MTQLRDPIVGMGPYLQLPPKEGGWDLNGNGSISLGEIEDLVRRQGRPGAPSVKGSEPASALAILKANFKDLEILGPNFWIFGKGVGIGDLREYERLFHLGQPINQVEANKKRTVTFWEEDFIRFAGRVQGTRRQLFVDGISSLSIQQGLTGDCSLLSTLASLASIPTGRRPGGQIIRSVRDIVAEINPGEFRVRFQGGFTPARNVSWITPTPPTDPEIALYATARENGLWLSVIEKAYVFGRFQTRAEEDKQWRFRQTDFYESLSCGEFLGNTIATITGNKTETIFLGTNVKPQDLPKLTDNVEKALINGIKTGAIMTAGTAKADPKKPENLGQDLPRGHAFAILDYNPKTQMLRIQNPWMLDKLHGQEIKYGTIFNYHLNDFVTFFNHFSFELI